MTDPPPGLAIVIPTRDRAHLLERLLGSLEAATMPVDGIDVVVVDDGSTDDTPSVVARSSLGIRRLNTGGSGPARARNAGWQATAAPLVVFLDDDCVVSPDSLVQLLAALDENDAVGADIRPLRRGGVASRLMHLEGLSRHRVDDGCVRYLVTAAVLFRRAALEQTGGFDESFRLAAGEDADLCYRLTRDGGRLDVALDATVWHDYRTGIVALWRTYYRHGTVQRQLLEHHERRKQEMRQSARRRRSIDHWLAVYRSYRREEGFFMSASCIGLRAVMMVPWLVGLVVGDRRRAPKMATNGSG